MGSRSHDVLRFVPDLVDLDSGEQKGKCFHKEGLAMRGLLLSEGG